MKMSTQFTASIQMLMIITVFKDGRITSETLSQSTGANPVMIRQLYGKLKNAGILNVSTGMGVTTLAKSPADISLWDIYLAIEGYNPGELFQFHPQISEGCQIGRFFKDILSVHLDEAVQALGEKLANVSLAQLLEEWDAVNLKEND
ncbi:MAG: Rrf2 family transcriptional regulator [Clostridium sp.]|nr:Rrf2 family transcriptional regulator [Clostridium sp.]